MIKKTLILFLLVLTCCQPKKNTNLFIISNITENKFLGDRAQSTSIEKKLKQGLQDHGISSKTKEFDIKNLGVLSSQLSESTKSNIIISSGDYGIKSLKIIKQRFSNKEDVITIWSGHHVFKNLWSDLDYLDVVIIPEYNASDELKTLAKDKNVKLITTPSIVSTINDDDIHEAYKKFNSKKLIPIDRNYLVVFLGGDAPDTNGDIKKLTKKDLSKLASYIKKISTTYKLKLVLTNNPRTKEWQTQFLLKELQNHGIHDYIFFDFNSGVRAYKPLLYILKNNTKNIAISTGESTSMVDEILQTQNKPIYIFRANNMSESHLRHMYYKVNNNKAISIDNINTQIHIPMLSEVEYSPDQDSVSLATKEILEIIAN